MAILPDLSVDRRRWTLPDLSGAMCHWPIGDDTPQLFCGAPKAANSRNYCADHHARAYEPRRLRRAPSAVDVATLVALAAAAEVAAS